VNETNVGQNLGRIRDALHNAQQLDTLEDHTRRTPNISRALSKSCASYAVSASTQVSSSCFKDMLMVLSGNWNWNEDSGR